ncbi:hypothetical protein RJ55_06939 [Drechmeria coniospora]|nr:hypothetical protein RJ55_06939 [Drechmeria coniospora]
MHLLSGPPLQGNPQGLALTREEGSPETAYPLTKSQESIWLEYQKDASSTKYNVTLEWEISDATKGAPCVRQVLQAIYALTERHAILRSTITSIDGAPHLTEWNTGIVDPDIHMVCRNNTISEQSLSRLLRRPFSLEVDPPVRWTVIQCPTALRVFLVGHHIVVDGHALSVLSKEFVVMLNDDGAQLPPPPSFSSMNLIEQQWLGSQSYLDSCKSVIDQVRTKNNSQWPRTTAAHKMTPENSPYRAIYTMHDFTIDELTAWGQQYSTTWFRVVSSVLALLVIDQTRPQFGMDEVLSVGFRGRPEGMHACVGQFANSLPVKFPLWEAQKQTGTFKTLVALVSKNISMVKKSELLSDMEIVPLAKTLNLDYQPPRIAITCPPKLANDNCHLYPLEGSWDVLFYFEHHLAGVKLGVIYDPAFVSSTQLNSMKLLLRNLVTISRRPDALLSEMLEWIPTYASLPAAVQSPQGNPMKHVHHWIQAHADTSPNSMALYSKEMKTSMTYGALDISAESKAKCLIVNGVPARGRVLINVRRGFQVIEWIFAVFKCGSAFAYMDPTLAEKQKAIIVRNFKPSLVVDDAFLRDVYSSFQEGTSEVNTKITSNNTAGDDLAYMIYTSGSTGEPKGVMVEHQNIAAFIQSSISAARCGFGSRILQLAAFTFDASILEWATALCTGGSLCFAQYPERLVGDYLADVIDENKISFLQITPTALETLPVSRKVPTLRYISVGGEAPSRETFAKWHSRVDLINVYGPTEAAVAVTYNLMEKATPLSKFVSAGIPNRGTGIHICDEGFGPILEQGVGEICISGAQVARGYCENPTITARNFAVHSSGIRMYRTGDRGMFLDDGSLVVLGRIDRELKIRGFRIAPEEIENAILEAGIGCHEASVQKSENGLEMIAFVSPATISPSELRTLLRNSLPGYKVPSRFYPLPTLPKSTTGKIDHKKVRMNLSKLTEEHDLGASLFPDDHASERKGYTSRASIQETTEEMVQRIWQQVLGASNSLPKDVNFFDVGGHSLLMPKLHEGLKAAFPTISVRLVDLFQHSTIHSQTLLLQGNSGGRSEVVTPFETAPGSSTHSSLRVSTVASPGIVTGATSPAILTPPLVEIDTNHHSGVAIVGLAGRFPKAANANEFYDKLMDGYSGITDFKKRTEPEAIPEAIWVPRAGVLDNIERFDNDFWKLSKEDATDMDPQHRIFMEVAHEALADAGMEAADLRRECVGLFIGAASDSYHLHTKSVIKDPFLLQTKSSMTPSISARAAYHLNLSGPNATVQTSCASSTVAFAMAYDAIRLGRCNVAIVGGVSIQLYEGGYLTRKGHILSTRGECNPFDSRADGQVPSDAVTAVVLRGYTAATEASTVSYANVMAAASGSDGAIDKAGFQVPSARGQAEVIKAAWRDAKVPSQGLQYAEIHGSGTVVGDALELEGLGLAMKELKLDGTRIAVGTAKGNIGNTQQSSGLVSLIKLCKSMQNGLVPAIKGLDEVHPAIDDTLPIDFARRRMRLHPGNLLAVSALGWGGVNCHIVLGFPREHLLKRSTKVLSESSFNHRILAAPRLKKAPIPVNHTAASQVTFASDNSNDHPAPATKPISLKERHVNEVKIDKAEQIQHSRTQSDENKQQKSDVEMELKKLWASVLVKPDTSISSSDSFLQIGGDSISALRLVSVARRHNIGLTVAMVFQHPQLSEMAAHAKVVKDEMSGIVRPFSLISNNEVDEVMNEIRDHHVDVSRFKAAWEMTVKKCANLRTRIVLVGDQHIQAEVTEDVLWRSVRTANPKAFLKSDHKLVMGYGTPLSRYTLLEDEGSNPKRYFVWTAHHAVFDGWTMQNIIKIFTSAYERSRIPSIRPFSAFVDYTMKLKAEESKAYWKEQLSGVQRSIFPFVEDEAKIGQDTKTTTQILQLQQRSQSSITKATIIRAAWAIVLARYNESDDICFGTVVSGRQAPVVDVESVTGPMIATVPVRVRLDKEQTVANFLHDVQAQALNMVPFEQFGLQNIAKVSDDAKKACELSNLIAVQPMEQMSSFDGDCSEVFVQTDDDEYDANEILESYFTYPLVAQAKVFESHISFEVTHKVDVVSEARIVALGHHMEHVTAQLLMCADSSDDKTMLLGEMSVAGSWDLQQATDFNMMEDPDSADACLHDVISQESQKASSREAIYTKDVSFTYGDLDQHSTRLAHELVRAGVQGDLVQYNSDGELEYVSRKATQRKICGQRFDLGDVEYRVRELGQGQISNLAAEVLQLQEVEFLAVFINLTEDETSSTQATSILPNTGPRQVFLKDLEQRISERIPSYMVPSYCIPVSRLPKSAAGEIDRAALRQLAESLAAQDLLPYSASRGSLFRDCSNDLEARLRKIWAQVLGIPTESISVDDDFYQLGGDSIRIITLMKLMKKHRIAAIVQSSSSIASPSEMPQIDVMSKLLAITDEAWAAEANLARIGAVATLPENATVFLTGATGFLGTEILRQLLQKKQIRTVAVLVRATSTLQGLQRIKRTAVIAKWWNDAYEEKLEIWTGDLGAKQLGLDGIYWNRLAGQAGDGNIDAIIHNGAVVNWNDDYEKLQAPNVDSTISLLKLAIASPAKPRLVYISGGIKTDPQDDRAKTSKKLAGTNGYAQTKYVSEAVISEIASRLSASTKQQQNRFSVVKPGLIIGTAKEGVANLDDFLWRITAAAAAMKIYPEESNNSWLYVSDSSTLSQKITRQLFVQEGEAFVDLSLGLPTSQFWGLVNSELDISCKPVPWESWIRSAEEQMQKAGERHVLWPVQHFLGGLGYTVKTCSPAEEGSELPLAIKANVRYLRRLGFIQQQSQEPTQVKGDVLRRSHAGAVA